MSGFFWAKQRSIKSLFQVPRKGIVIIFRIWLCALFLVLFQWKTPLLDPLRSALVTNNFQYTKTCTKITFLYFLGFSVFLVHLNMKLKTPKLYTTELLKLDHPHSLNTHIWLKTLSSLLAGNSFRVDLDVQCLWKQHHPLKEVNRAVSSHKLAYSRQTRSQKQYYLGKFICASFIIS